ncbi:MAG TPA: gamma-glutamylcyclotransferase family protein [Thermoclostridium sp.]
MVPYEKELMKNKINKVFVYGTLMQNFSNYKKYLAGRISRITPGRTYGVLYHLPEGYPALIPGNEKIEGEIMEPVDENLLKSLDKLEDYDECRSNNLYNRELRSILTEDGEDVLCWIYVYADAAYAKENGIHVPDGNWRKFMENKGEWICTGVF